MRPRLRPPRRLLSVAPEFIIAVSLGAVFFGAMTYIGNGPNFMVKAIADAAGVKTPGFFGYIFKFSLPGAAAHFAAHGLDLFYEQARH